MNDSESLRLRFLTHGSRRCVSDGRERIGAFWCCAGAGIYSWSHGDTNAQPDTSACNPHRSMYEVRHIEDLVHAKWTSLERLADTDSLSSSLAAGGLSSESCSQIAAEIERCRVYVEPVKASRGVLTLFVPGRIEILGKHTDYAGGGSLTCAVQRGVSAVAVPRDDGLFTLTDTRSAERAELQLGRDRRRPGHWSDYAVNVSRRLSRDFPGLQRGLDIAFSSNLPPASGMSSSSALTVAVALLVLQANEIARQDRFSDLFEHTEDLAQYLGAIEAGLPYLTLDGDTGVGTFGGSEDQTAILCSQPGLLKWYSYSPVRFREGVVIPEHHVFALAFTGIHAPKTGHVRERYNYLSDSSAAVAAAWRMAMDRDEPHLGAISSIPGYSRTEVALAIREFPGDRYTVRELTDRLDHFHHENNLILPAAVEALKAHRLDRFGDLVDRSQHLAETLLQNQTHETGFLARTARASGAAASSAFGAGFGGTVWALVHRDSASDFLETWSAQYTERHPEAAARSAFFLDTPGPAAFQVAE